MVIYYTDHAVHAELFDKVEKRIAYISKKSWKENIGGSGAKYHIVGHTDLKTFVKEKDEAALAVIQDAQERIFRVRRYLPVRTKGYIPVGNNEYIKVRTFEPLRAAALILLAVCVGIAMFFLAKGKKHEIPEVNRYIENAESPERNNDMTATRYRFNTTLTVIKNTIQDLNFENLNRHKQLRITIKAAPGDKELIYDSGLIPEGRMVTADVLKKKPGPGTYKTVAECFAYDEKGRLQSQTNFEVRLSVQ